MREGRKEGRKKNEGRKMKKGKKGMKMKAKRKGTTESMLKVLLRV